MPKLITSALLALLLATLGGCASDGTGSGFFSTGSDETSTSNYFFSEFPDIPIPNEMSESRGDTFITFSPSGVKTGVQRFSGRVELVSLMNTMRRNMAANGWTLRSLLRAKESVLVFEKPDRLAAFQISDGLIFTEMRIFVTSRLEGDAPVSDTTYGTGYTSANQPLSQ